MAAAAEAVNVTEPPSYETNTVQPKKEKQGFYQHVHDEFLSNLQVMPSCLLVPHLAAAGAHLGLLGCRHLQHPVLCLLTRFT